ncbi:MAG: hypothetical protein O7D35_02895 [Acidobacteria bacterium]|nr:hypothetical protein [Acidobacteriota bacterium]
MSLRLEMLQVARLAPKALGEASRQVLAYLQDQVTEDGGFADRRGNSDLYYTIFGLEGLRAFQAPLPTARVSAYLRSFGVGEGLDLVHVASLIRCWASLPAGSLDESTRQALGCRLGRFRTPDGGYALDPSSSQGTIYHAFLAYGACQDLGLPVPDREPLLAVLRRLRTDDGAYANEAIMPMGTTPVTAAAVTLMRQMSENVDPGTGRWLLERAAVDGGFFALPGAPVPDLLSTATALHALAAMETSFQMVKEPCLDFVDSLWTGKGFCGNWSDEVPDVEYTYYALLALGHLSL